MLSITTRRTCGIGRMRGQGTTWGEGGAACVIPARHAHSHAGVAPRVAAGRRVGPARAPTHRLGRGRAAPHLRVFLEERGERLHDGELLDVVVDTEVVDARQKCFHPQVTLRPQRIDKFAEPPCDLLRSFHDEATFGVWSPHKSQSHRHTQRPARCWRASNLSPSGTTHIRFNAPAHAKTGSMHARWGICTTEPSRHGAQSTVAERVRGVSPSAPTNVNGLALQPIQVGRNLNIHAQLHPAGAALHKQARPRGKMWQGHSRVSSFVPAVRSVAGPHRGCSRGRRCLPELRLADARGAADLGELCQRLAGGLQDHSRIYELHASPPTVGVAISTRVRRGTAVTLGPTGREEAPAKCRGPAGEHSAANSTPGVQIYSPRRHRACCPRPCRWSGSSSARARLSGRRMQFLAAASQGGRGETPGGNAQRGFVTSGCRCTPLE